MIDEETTAFLYAMTRKMGQASEALNELANEIGFF